MIAKQIAKDIYSIPLGMVNAFLVDRDGLTLIDTGDPGSADKILTAVSELGKLPSDIRQIVVTHCHTDHSGSLADLKKLTGAKVYMHKIDADMVRQGKSLRPLVPGPGLMLRMLFWWFLRSPVSKITPAEIDYEIKDGDELAFAGGLKVIHIPGHCAGQVALLSQRDGGFLFAADVAANNAGLTMSIAYEDIEIGKRSIEKVSKFNFEGACFGHGSAISKGAAEKFRKLGGSI